MQELFLHIQERFPRTSLLYQPAVKEIVISTLENEIKSTFNEDLSVEDYYFSQGIFFLECQNIWCENMHQYTSKRERIIFRVSSVKPTEIDKADKFQGPRSTWVFFLLEGHGVKRDGRRRRCRRHDGIEDHRASSRSCCTCEPRIPRRRAHTSTDSTHVRHIRRTRAHTGARVHTLNTRTKSRARAHTENRLHT